MGNYDTKQLPIYQYLHRTERPELRHRRPLLPGGVRRLVPQPPVADRRPGPARHQPRRRRRGATRCSTATGWSTPTRCTRRPATVNDGQLTQQVRRPGATTKYAAPAATSPSTRSSRPARPHAATGAQIPLIDDAKYPNIGDRLTRPGISWNWYSGGWDDAAAGHPGPLFQYHHQPFNYFAELRPRAARTRPPARTRRRSSTAAKTGTPADGQLRQAVRRRERAPRLRQRAERQRPPGRPAQDDHQRTRRPRTRWSS